MWRRTVNIINIRTRRANLYLRAGLTSELNTRKYNKTFLNDISFKQNLEKNIGQTVTVFTVSGGDSGSGFTGVLLDVKKDHIKILSRLASGPGTYEDIDLGAISNIPVDKIAAFVHNAI